MCIWLQIQNDIYGVKLYIILYENCKLMILFHQLPLSYAPLIQIKIYLHI